MPHLYLNNEPPPEVLDYLESLADARPERSAPTTITINTVPSSGGGGGAESGAVSKGGGKAVAPRKVSPVRSSKPSILKRKRPPKQEPADDENAPEPLDEMEGAEADDVALAQAHEEDTSPRVKRRAEVGGCEEELNVKLTLIHREIAETIGLKPGQTVLIRRRVDRK